MNVFNSARAGIGLKIQHIPALLDAADTANGPGWVEVHPQNYFVSAKAQQLLVEVSQHYPVSLHSTGLSLGSADGLNQGDLDQLAALCDVISPALISDHLSFSGNAQNRLPDLLPIAYTCQALEHFARQICTVQDRLGRQLLIENPARYLSWRHSDMTEPKFLAQLIAATGCGLLLDISNIFVTTGNVGGTVEEWLAAIDPDWVKEIHLAGHIVEDYNGAPFYIDDHGSAVPDHIWAIYADVIARFGPKPTLIEWDNDTPDFGILLAEAKKADAIKKAQYAYG
jgi:uncharacterized protein